MTAPVMKPSEALRRARELLTPEGAWCQVQFAKDRNGIPVYADDPAACCWCLYGALEKAAPSNIFYTARAFLLRATSSASLMLWNDKEGQTKDNVIDAICHAAALAEAAGQ